MPVSEKDTASAMPRLARTIGSCLLMCASIGRSLMKLGCQCENNSLTEGWVCGSRECYRTHEAEKFLHRLGRRLGRAYKKEPSLQRAPRRNAVKSFHQGRI